MIEGDVGTAAALLEESSELGAAGASADRRPSPQEPTYLVHEAVLSRNHRMLAALLEAGADPNEENLADETALEHGVLAHDVESARLLTCAGARSNVASRLLGWRTLLQAAVADAAGHGPKLVRVLLDDGGAYVNRRSSAGGRFPSALQLAVERNDAATCRLLLDRGARVELAEEDGSLSALELAMERKNVEVLGLLLEKLSVEGRVNQVRDSRQKGILHAAVLRGNTRIVRQVLAVGA